MRLALFQKMSINDEIDTALENVQKWWDWHCFRKCPYMMRLTLFQNMSINYENAHCMRKFLWMKVWENFSDAKDVTAWENDHKKSSMENVSFIRTWHLWNHFLCLRMLPSAENNIFFYFSVGNFCIIEICCCKMNWHFWESISARKLFPYVSFFTRTTVVLELKGVDGPPPPPSNKSTRCLPYLLVCLATNPKATNPMCNKPNKVTNPVSNKPL